MKNTVVNVTKSVPVAVAGAQSPELILQRFDQAVQVAAAALREMSAAAAGAVLVSELKDAVDYLGHLKAQAATVEEIEKQLKAVLIASGKETVDGELFKATISRFNQDRLDMDAVREKLSPQFIAAHTTSKPVTQVRVSARNTL